MSTRDYLAGRARWHLEQSAAVKREVADRCLDAVVAAAGLLVTGFRHGGRRYLCGNGGSAADCQTWPPSL